MHYLGRNVSVLKKAIDGTTSTVNAPSLPCLINWGKPPTLDFIPQVPTKEIGDLTPFYDKLRDHFIPKNLLPVSSQCVNPVVSLSGVNVSILRSFAKDYELELYCRALTSIEQVARLLFSISWFLYALWTVLDA